MRKLALIIPIFLLAGCKPDASAQSVKQTQAQKAQEVANSISFTENAEIDNIKNRLELTSKPGQLGFVLLLNEMGQPIMYEGVRGKITSSSKRLTPPIKRWEVDKGEFRGTEMHAAESDEGTWGSSDPYVYYWNLNGEYRQWNGKYLYSDKPFRLRQEPLVINIEGDKK